MFLKQLKLHRVNVPADWANAEDEKEEARFPCGRGLAIYGAFNYGESTTSGGGETLCGIKDYPIESVMVF